MLLVIGGPATVPAPVVKGPMTGHYIYHVTTVNTDLVRKFLARRIKKLTCTFGELMFYPSV